MSVPFANLRDASPVPPTQLMPHLGGEDETFYQLFFQQPGLAESVFEVEIARTLHASFYGISGAAPAEVRHATIYVNEERAAAAADQPLLFIAGDLDPVLDMYPGTYETLEERVPNLRKKVLLPNIGHWVQQEAAEEVNALLLDFLKNL